MLFRDEIRDEFQYDFLKAREPFKLFYSTTEDRKYDFFKNSMLNVELRDVGDVSCSVYTPNSGNIVD